MNRRTSNPLAIILVLAIALTGGAALILGGTATPDVDAPFVAAPSGTTTVVGVVLAIDSGGLSDVRGFTLRTADGQVFEFSLAKLENGATFPPGHLAEHVATATPILVKYRDASGTLEAIRIDDAD